MPAEPKRVERMSLYVDAKLVAEVMDCTVSYDNGAEQQDGFDGADYYTKGNKRTSIQFSTVVPKKGMSVNVKKLCREDKTVTLTTISNGEVESVTGIIKTAEVKSESKSGMQSGQFGFIGGDTTVS